MILGIGCDIVQIDRIADVIRRHGERFIHRIMHPKEIPHVPQKDELAVRYIAKRFAAKEAYAKALGTGIGAQLRFSDVWIVSSPDLSSKSGKPQLGCDARALCATPPHRVHVSLSDEKDYAIAYVVIELLL